MQEERWTEPEKWVWQEIRAGRIADFNARDGERALDPSTSQGWSEMRKLSADFLVQILLRKPNSAEIPEEGVRIMGAWFAEAVDLSAARLARSLWLDKCRFEGPVALSALQIQGLLSLDGSSFDGKLHMDGVEVVQQLLMQQGAKFKEVDLANAKIGGLISLMGATVDGRLDMSGLNLAQHLFMRGGTRFKEVDLTSAKIGGQISLVGATVDGKLNMNGLDVAQHVLMRGAKFKDVDLTNAKVGDQLNFNGSTVDGALVINGLVARDIFMSAKFNEVDLTATEVRGRLSLDGATVEGKLEMNGLHVARHLFMRGGARFKDVSLMNAKIGGQVGLIGATVDGKLDMNGLDVAQHLLMHTDAIFKEVDLTGAKVGGQLRLEGATVEGKLIMSGLDVALGLFMSGDAKFKEVDLASAKIGGQLVLDGATVDGKLDMNGLDLAQTLFMSEGATFKEVNLTASKVGGQINLIGATVDGEMSVDSILVEEDVFMRNSTFNKRVALLFARCKRNLDLSNSKLTELDLSGTRIEGELRLGSDQHHMTLWRKASGLSLNLRNVHAGALQDRREKLAEQGEKRHRWWQLFGSSEQWVDAWPSELQLEGFTYDRLGGFGGTPERIKDMQDSYDVDMQARDVQWYIEWLDRDHSYSPQPYEQLAGAFRRSGEPTKANRILYQSRRRARAEAWRRRRFPQWLGSLFLDWTIGYGLGGRYFRALGWVVAFTAVGAGVLHFSGQPSVGLDPGLPARLVYSLDQLLPIVEFEKYDKVVLKGGVAYYFYIQKLVGWLLGSFLVAGLAGLTQK